MRKSLLVPVAFAMLSVQTAAQAPTADCGPVFPVGDVQVRPGDCPPVFPVADAPQPVPNDVVAEQAAPQASAKRKFIGLPFFLPIFFAGGVIALIHHHHNPTVSPA